jgi:hypothetical protein
MTPSSRLINLLQWLPELREILIYRFIRKDTMKDTDGSQMDKTHKGEIWEEGQRVSLYAHPTQKPSLEMMLVESEQAQACSVS